MKIEQVMLSPAQAAKLLEKNTTNRKLSRARVAAFTAIIERGEWVLDGNPIKICVDETVIDGQHRLGGIAEADVESVPVLLITGLPAEARRAVDNGKARSFADYLEIERVPNSLTMAAAVRGTWNYAHGLYAWKDDWFKRPVPSIPQLWEWYQKNSPALTEAVSRANQVIRVVRLARAPVATAWVALGEVECERCGPAAADREDFFDQLTMMTTGDPSDGAMALIRMMNRRGQYHSDGTSGGAGGRSHFSQTEQLALTLKAWNAYREGRPIKTLVWRRGGKGREEFPIPH